MANKKNPEKSRIYVANDVQKGQFLAWCERKMMNAECGDDDNVELGLQRQLSGRVVRMRFTHRFGL